MADRSKKKKTRRGPYGKKESIPEEGLQVLGEDTLPGLDNKLEHVATTTPGSSRPIVTTIHHDLETEFEDAGQTDHDADISLVIDEDNNLVCTLRSARI